MVWPGLRKCTAYLSLGQDSLPSGVRWFSDGLGGAGGRGWEERGATVDETGLEGREEGARIGPPGCPRTCRQAGK